MAGAKPSFINFDCAKKDENLTGCTGPYIFQEEVSSSTWVLPQSGNRVEGTDDGTGYHARRI